MLISLTAAYLILPAVLFLGGWLRWPLALAGWAAIGIYGLALFRAYPLRLRQAARPGRWWLWGGGAAGMILVWLFFSGVGGFGYQNFDYQANNALLKDLVTRDWPLVVTFQGQPTHLVYYVAYYLLAALVGKAFGWAAANGALFAWTFVGLLLAFAWFVRVSRVAVQERPARLLWLALIFCLAGGLDLVATRALSHTALRLSDHIEPWAQYFQYTGNTALIYWVPQHTIAIWLLAGWLADAFFNASEIHTIGVPVACGMIWSPFGMVGLVPLVLVNLARQLLPDRRERLLIPRALLLYGCALLLALFFGLYLGSNQFHFANGWIWETVNQPGALLERMGQFWVFEFGLAAFLTVMLLLLSAVDSAGGRLPHSAGEAVQRMCCAFGLLPGQVWIFVLCLLVLSILPVYKMGLHNDLAMRGSIAPLFLFWAFLCKVLLDGAAATRRRLRPLLILLAVILVVGFYPSIAEIARSVENYHFGPPDFDSVSTSGEVNSYEIVVQKIANENTIFYRFLSK